MKLIFDVECYTNYFLVMFKNIDSGNVQYFEMHNDDDEDFNRDKLRRLIKQHTIIGFNSQGYDIPMVKAAIAGFSNKRLKEVSDAIIVKRMKYWEIDKHYGFPYMTHDHIDLINVTPTSGSLKIYGGRANAPKMQDLPFDPAALISSEDAANLREYCINDLDLTEILYDELPNQIELRRIMSANYGINLMAKSDAQIAEAVFRHELVKLDVNVHKIEIAPGTTFKYRVPDFIKFETDALKAALDRVREAEFVVNDKGSVTLPKELNKQFEFGDAKYKMGIGGLHSCEKAQIVTVGENQYLMEKDVTSYYPQIILNQGLYPKHLTSKFNRVYYHMVQERLTAKASGDKSTAESLKIVINSSFGKFGSIWSSMYAPDMLIQTTITGQLALLMLIEQLTEIGVRVCSANTDGIVILYDDVINVDDACFEWELSTGLNLDDKLYRAIYSRDVNNYLAVETDGKYKGKGIFTLGGLSKNPSTNICYRAVIEHIINGADISDHIHKCTDMSEFISIRTVKGGADFRGELIGKAVRWYYSTESDDCITYASNGNKVAKTDGAMPMMQMAPIPDDLDYDWYIAEAHTILESVGLCGYEGK